MIQLNALTESYIATALWSSTDETGAPLDDKFTADDLAPEALERALLDTATFITEAGALLDGYRLQNVMHDFWLTRNGHGAGFWDGDYSDEIGKALTELSKKFGQVDLYVGDDGKLYMM